MKICFNYVGTESPTETILATGTLVQIIQHRAYSTEYAPVLKVWVGADWEVKNEHLWKEFSQHYTINQDVRRDTNGLYSMFFRIPSFSDNFRWMAQ
jgi:hypothetical protein